MYTELEEPTYILAKSYLALTEAKQGDRNGRIFTYWPMLTLDSFIESSRIRQNIWAAFSR
jgi:hypothetical protein